MSAGGKWTLRLVEIEGHGYSFEASDGDGKYVGTFDRIEVLRYKAYEEHVAAGGDEAEVLPPGLVIEAGDEYR